jgi:hypothetical protein
MDPRWKAEPRSAIAALVKQASEWWRTLNYPTFGDNSNTEPSNWLGLALFKAALEGGPTVKSASWEGNLTTPPANLLEAISAVAGTRLLKVADRGNSNGTFILASEETMVSIILYSSGMEGSATLVTVNEDVYTKLAVLFNRAFIADNPAEGIVFSLARGMGGYSISRVGLAGTPLQRGNYSPEVLADYDHVVKEQATESPCGRLIILSGAPGCHRRGQLILMYDGTLKTVENIEVGDKLMGPDSTPRSVLGLCRGVEEMVEVAPFKGEPWVVNRGHILTLIRTKYNGRAGYRAAGDVKEVPVRDYLEWSRTQKDCHKLFRVAVDFPKQTERLPLDPYFLGVLLGDGTLGTTPKVTTEDVEIVEECHKQAARFEMDVTMYDQDGTKPPTYALCRSGGLYQHDGRGINPIAMKLAELNLLEVYGEDKFIPPAYKVASKEDRLEVLAGLIDTDGSLDEDGVGYDFVNKSEELVNDLAFIARSLGFACYPSPCTKKSQNGTEGVYHRMFISGDISQIPVHVEHKKAPERMSPKNVLRTGFKTRDLPAEDFFGFALDGDQRYLLDDFTVTHNTGKTYLVRSILSDAPKTAYVLVPANLIESLGSPEILPALTQAKREFEGPIMLIIEDADYALVQRGEKNMNAISSMLNLGDGILGSILDVRILATTNAEKLQMDPATQRPGRLCRHIEVGVLPPANATAALSRLLGKAVRPFTEPVTLAQVYAAARAQGWMPPPKAKNTAGKYARPELV